MRTTSVALLLALALFGCASSEDEAESAKKRCTALRDHLIDLRLESANDLVDKRAHRAALQQALGDEFVENCSRRSVDEIKCSLAAKDTESVAACSPATSQ